MGRYTGTQAGASSIVDGREFRQKLAFAALDVGKSIGSLESLVADSIRR